MGIYQIKDSQGKPIRGAWEVRWVDGYYDNGRRRDRSKVVNGTKAEAESYERLMMSQAGKTNWSGSNLTTAVYVNEIFMVHAKKNLSSNTNAYYLNRWEKYCAAQLGNIRLEKIRPALIIGLLNDIESPHTRLSVYKTLSAIFGYAFETRELTENPMQFVKKPKTERKDIQVFSPSETLELMDHFRGHKIEPIVLLSLFYGMRREEACAVLCQDFSWRTYSVRVNKAMVVVNGKLEVKETKNKKSVRSISQYGPPAERLKEICSLRIGPTVSYPNAQAIRPDTMSSLFSAHLKTSKLPQIPFKNLRHTCITNWLLNGVDPAIVARWAGHSDTSMIMEVYANPLQESMEKAAQDVSARMFKTDRLCAKES